jgi:uncharacterized integral membrane protein
VELIDEMVDRLGYLFGFAVTTVCLFAVFAVVDAAWKVQEPLGFKVFLIVLLGAPLTAMAVLVFEITESKIQAKK